MAAQARTEKQVSDLAKQVEKSGLPELGTTLKTLDEVLGGIDDVKGDIPGVGPLDANKPDAALPPKGKQIRQLSAQLRNSILKARSGGAVTPQEATRLLQELGLEDRFRTAIHSRRELGSSSAR